MKSGWDDKSWAQWLMLLAGALLAIIVAPESPRWGILIAVVDIFFAILLASGFFRGKDQTVEHQLRVREIPIEKFVQLDFAPRQDQVMGIHELAQSVQETLQRNMSIPMVSAISAEVSRSISELVEQTNLIDQRRMELEGFAEERPQNQADLDDLRKRIEREHNEEVKRVLHATYERKAAEIENVGKMSESLRYMDALLESAEATLSELRSRIGLAVAKSDDYVNKERNLQLQDTSSELRSISEAMRVTLGELK